MPFAPARWPRCSVSYRQAPGSTPPTARTRPRRSSGRSTLCARAAPIRSSTYSARALAPSSMAKSSRTFAGRKTTHDHRHRTLLRILNHKPVQPVEPAFEFVHRGGIRDAHVPIGPESLARDHRYVSFGEEALRELNRVLDAAFAEGYTAVRVSIEGSARLGATYSGDLPQPANHKVAALLILREHDADGLLGAAQSLHRGLLRNRCGIRSAVALQLGHGRNDG